jgi:DNA-binding response OmpR family regulator
MKATILLVEGKRAEHPSFLPQLRKKGFQVETASSGSHALGRLEDVDPDVVIVDAASLRTSGKRICQNLRNVLDGLPLILITDRRPEDPPPVDAVLVLPFTVQKLINRMRPLLPAEEDDLIHIGPIRLYQRQRRLRCLGKQARLTPRLVMLLKVLLEHHGEVVEREGLFRHVWDTEYTGDTRTLDVHISWLREALETDPRHPRFLKTVRGVGYRLDV